MSTPGACHILVVVAEIRTSIQSRVQLVLSLCVCLMMNTTIVVIQASMRADISCLLSGPIDSPLPPRRARAVTYT